MSLYLYLRKYLKRVVLDCVFLLRLGVHIFGLCVTALITDILQLSTGLHAPYWLEVCKPNLTHVNMSTCEEGFILEDICSGQDQSLITAGRKSFPSQHATLAAFAAVYISMYFNTVLTDSAKLLKPLLVFSVVMLAILAGLTRIIQFRNHPVDVYCGWLLGAAIAVYLVGQAHANPTLSAPIVLPMLTRSASYREPSMSMKRASAEVEILSPPSPSGNRDNMSTFNSSTLPRSHGGSSMEEGRVPRRHASIHASMDSTRSKQLLSQWKNKNDNRKLSLQVMDGIRPAPCSSPQRGQELRCVSEPPLRAGGHIPAQYMKLAASSIPMVPNHNHHGHNGGAGMGGGARVSIQSRPGSSQLVHIPEEDNSNSKDQESESEDSMMDGGGSVREKWLRVAEKTTLPCRPLSAGGQPRLMQVIALSKQQGLLHSPRSEDGGSSLSCTGSIRGLERTGSIVRVEAHPESKSNKPVVKPPSTDGSGSWRWKPPDQRPSLRQSAFNLNELGHHGDDPLAPPGPPDGRRSVIAFAPPFHPHPQSITTIRVTPVEGGTAASSDGGSDSQSVASSSRESTLNRESSSNSGPPERGPTPDLHPNHRILEEGMERMDRMERDSSVRFQENLRNFQESTGGHHALVNRQLQGMFARSGPTPPPTMPRPILTHTPPPPWDWPIRNRATLGVTRLSRGDPV
uniref:Phospholipid phosphatase related 4a n=1 Tax=Neogobius melanostomus TaxID=47308 RepID=A0A8C6WJ33_9GOBI